MPRLFLVALAAVGSGWANAQVPAHLSHVPPDAAVFAHANVAKLWKGPVGEPLRAAKVAEFDRLVADFEAVTGLTPADVTSASAYWPDLRKLAPDIEPFVVTLVLTKPIDAGRLVAAAAVGCRASGDRVSYRFEKGVLTLKSTTIVHGRGEATFKFQEIVLDLSDALHPRLSVYVPAAAGVAPKGSGPQTTALVAAATKDFVVSMNYAMLPANISDVNARWGPDRVPLIPLLKADQALAVGTLAGDTLAVEARFRSADPAVRRECAKSLGALQTLLTSLLDAGLKGLGKSNDAKDKPLLAVLASFKTSLDAAALRIDGTDAVATLALRTDLPFGLALGATAGKKSLDARDRSVTQNNLKQLGLALHAHHDVYNAFPAPAVADKKGKPLLSWRVAVLPQIEQGALATRFKMDEAWDSDHNKKALQDNPMPAVFALPGVTLPGDKETYFRVFVGNGAAFEPLKPLMLAFFTDGSSNTILVATAATAVPWTKPDELDFEPKGDMKKLLRMDGDGCNVLLADGSARFLSSAIDVVTLRGLITRGGGEVLNLD